MHVLLLLCYTSLLHMDFLLCHIVLCCITLPNKSLWKQLDNIWEKKKSLEIIGLGRQLMYVTQSYVFPNNSQQIHWYHSVFVPAFKPFLAQLAVQGSARRGEELSVGMNESLFCRDSWLPVHLGRDGKCSSCHKHSAFLSAPSITNTDGERRKERRKKTGMKGKKKK